MSLTRGVENIREGKHRDAIDEKAMPSDLKVDVIREAAKAKER